MRDDMPMVEFAMAKRGRARRVALKLKPGMVAKRMGVTYQRVWQLERSGCSNLATIRKWAAALEMKPSELAFGGDE